MSGLTRMALHLFQPYKKMISPYDQVAGEYYAPSHRTSRNFDQIAAVALAPYQDRVPNDGLVLEVGAGRGRSGEFLGIPPERVIQLDSSRNMLSVEPRELCIIRVAHAAEELPFLDGQFACVTAFLCDPFLGLNFLSEVARVLRSGGVFIATTPAFEWGAPLRKHQGLSTSVARFVTAHGQVLVPSNLIPRTQLLEMLEVAGFDHKNISITSHRLPADADPISQDILTPAEIARCDVHELEVLYSIVAVR